MTSVPHEAWHAVSGMGELTAYPIGYLVALKYRLMNKFPNLKTALSRRVEYRRVTRSEAFPDAEKYGDRVEHYERVN